VIDTLGPGRVWGGGGGVPPGPPDVTLVSTNTVVEDGNRQGNTDSGGTTNTGELYQYRLTNPGHDSCEVTSGGIGPGLATVSAGSLAVIDWQASLAAAQGPSCPTAGAPTQIGFVTIPAQIGAGHFEFSFTANYCNACGPVVVDESFTLELWGPL
jgi:hypothetical protein